METINKRKPGNSMYAVTFKGNLIYVYANSEAAAKQYGTEYFKLKKKEVPLLSVELAVYK